MYFSIKRVLPIGLCIATAFFLLSSSCKSKKILEQKEEQISAETDDVLSSSRSNGSDTNYNSIQGNASMMQIPSTPNAVLLTSMPNHRLLTIYKSKIKDKSGIYSSSYGGDESEMQEHFMPGFDILYGYNLLNITHIDLQNARSNYLLPRAGLIKTLYFPSAEPDTLNGKPIKRINYLLSVYDEDTNKDTLINRKDLRHFYSYDSTGTNRTLLVPANYSVLRSQYEYQNDDMYLFAVQDANKNGSAEKGEPLHVFYINLRNIGPAKMLY